MNPIPDVMQTEIIRSFELFQRLYPEQSILFFESLESICILKPLPVNSRKKFQPFITKQLLKIQEGIFSSENLTTAEQRLFFDHFGIDILSVFRIGTQLFGFAVSGVAPANKEDIVSAIKSQTALLRLALDNYVLQEILNSNVRRSQRLLNEMTALHEFSRSIESSKNIETLLKFLVNECMLLMNSEAGSLMLVILETQELEFKVALGPKSKQVKPFHLKMGQGIAGWVAKNKTAVLIPDAYADMRFDPSFDKRSGFRTKSYLCVPLIHKKKALGVLTVLNRLDGRPFTESDQDMLCTFATQAALAIENSRLLQAALEKERIEKELQVAAQIQQLLIPQTLPQIEGLDIAATYIPCKEVSGDFYDMIRLNDEQYVLIVADVSGKSIPGALLVSTMQATLKAYFEYSRDLLSVIENLNKRIMQLTTADRYITFFFGIYNVREGSFTYINAGHNPPILLNAAGDITELRTGGIFLGSLPWKYEQETVPLTADSVLLMYSDGLTEAMNSREEEFGEDRLKVLLRENRRGTAERIRQSILDGVHGFVNGQPLQDDFTLIVIKRDGMSG